MVVNPDASDHKQGRSRLRELSKYYCAISSFTNSTEFLNAQSKTGQERSSPTYLDPDAFVLAEPRLTTDHTLTALAQLATLKLQCQRCFISLIDENAQHVIAEATKSISLFDQDDHLPGDGLILGMQSIPLNYGLSALALDAFIGPSKLFYDVPGNEATRDYISISDLTLETVTQQAGVLINMAVQLKYYLAVPLRSESGTFLGMLSVSNTTAHPKSIQHIKSLQGIAKLVVKHLDGFRTKEDLRRTERLLGALSHFIQGQGTIDTTSQESEQSPAVVEEPVQRPPLSSLSLSSSPSPLSSSSKSPSVVASSRISSPDSPLLKDAVHSDLSSKRSSKVFPNSEVVISEDSSGQVVSLPPSQIRPGSTSANQSLNADFTTPPQPWTKIDSQSTSLTSSVVREAFSRASNLIRESMDLEATCFLEIPQNERFKNPMRKHTDSAKGLSEQPSSATQRTSESSSDANLSDDSHNNDDVDQRRVSDVLCHRLGFSSREKSSFASSTTTQGFMTVSVRLLTRLTAKYPNGHIFHFDESGNLSSSDDNTKLGMSTTNTRGRLKVSGELHAHFPAARSLIFLPLYDNERQTQYAGFLGWTTDPARSLQDHEVVYVLGFANSLMCEVMRLETLATDKAKSDFISSISHELRSPLHGILAAGQLLSESRVSSSQAEFVEMIDTCARTLLDIMDHLLEHAKINHFTASQNTKSKPRTKDRHRVGRRSQNYSLVTQIDLLSVVEETVESMAASNYHMHRRDGSTTGSRTPFSEKSFFSNDEPSSLPIILSVDFHNEWKFNTEAGSWRRIIMNLVGNALKYTQRGHVAINLSVKRTQDSKYVAELIVSDTGQGISEEFLKHRLYTPFSQEDNLSVGVGLGLSIIRQIVTSLRGKVRVNSEVGVGTEFIVQIPLERPSYEMNTLLSTATESQLLIPELVGKTVKFYGFDVQFLPDSDTSMASQPRAKAFLTLSESLSSLMTDWFGMIRVMHDVADILVIEESFLNDNPEILREMETNVIVLGSAAQQERSRNITNANIVYALSPIGPQRMERTLRNLLLEWRTSDTAGKANSPETNGCVTTEPAIPDIDINEKFTTPIQPSTGEHATLATVSNLTLIPARANSLGLTPPRSPGTASPRDDNKEVILLVDDNEINLRILANCVKRFQSSKVQFAKALNGREALDTYIAVFNKGQRVSLVFMDISMPIMDGFTSTRLIREFEKSRGIDESLQAVIVAFTGLASKQAQHDIEKYGFDLYLRKPVNMKTVREVVTTTLARSGRVSPLLGSGP